MCFGMAKVGEMTKVDGEMRRDHDCLHDGNFLAPMHVTGRRHRRLPPEPFRRLSTVWASSSSRRSSVWVRERQKYVSWESSRGSLVGLLRCCRYDIHIYTSQPCLLMVNTIMILHHGPPSWSAPHSSKYRSRQWNKYGRFSWKKFRKAICLNLLSQKRLGK